MTPAPQPSANPVDETLWVSGSVVGYNGERWTVLRNLGSGKVLLSAGGVTCEAPADELGEAPEAEEGDMVPDYVTRTELVAALKHGERTGGSISEVIYAAIEELEKR